MNFNYVQIRKLHIDMQNLDPKFVEEMTVPTRSTPEDVTSSGSGQVNAPPTYRNDITAHTFSVAVT